MVLSEQFSGSLVVFGGCLYFFISVRCYPSWLGHSSLVFLHFLFGCLCYSFVFSLLLLFVVDNFSDAGLDDYDECHHDLNPGHMVLI